MKKKITTFFLILITTVGFSQNFLSWKYEDRYFSFSVGTGTTTYFGELNTNNSLSFNISQISFGVEARVLNHFGARLEASSFNISGNDNNAPDSSFQKQRNLSFESKNYHFQLHVIYYFKPYSGDYYKRGIFNPYLFTGVGYLNFNPIGVVRGKRYSLREAKTEGVSYKKWITTLPIGLGSKFKINDFFNINLEVSYHFTFTDYLDDVSQNYATELPNSTAELLSDRKNEVGVINQEFYDQIQSGASRGNPDNNDHFLQINLKVEFFLPATIFSKK